jgi:hypothetical protein
MPDYEEGQQGYVLLMGWALGGLPSGAHLLCKVLHIATQRTQRSGLLQDTPGCCCLAPPDAGDSQRACTPLRPSCIPLTASAPSPPTHLLL